MASDITSSGTAVSQWDGDHSENRGFRVVLRAMSRPGAAVRVDDTNAIDNGQLPPAISCLARCLIGAGTPVWVDAAFNSPQTKDFLSLFCGATMVDEPTAAAFAFVGSPADMLPINAFELGEQDYPDRSTTLVVWVPDLMGGPSVTLTGPGIKTTVTIEPKGLPAWFWPAWDDNTKIFPRGIDIFFTDGVSLVGLPRTSRRN
ncbi:phosphonate C-P lyase system protein PhnH [Phyllobacterium sophorae]|uniref:Phosphonate C-P lyase system protein PhnH n=1 Tax=Phyllobacterium sophorae TaxID=1520277 RepID=A0A2P7AQI6_9HYPH|nr:phosphonate C-P lyase system protein PhnH [Phyllobacterium sophorae]PSH56498.1 phosphonate C-P lyase system protein PhnH [Phyllobacterium sophorae]